MANDDNRNVNSEPPALHDKNVSKIIGGLTGHPDHLLFFGLIFVILTALSGIFFIYEDTAEVVVPMLALLGFVTIVMGSLIAFVYLNRSGHKDSNNILADIGDTELVEHMSQYVENIKTAVEEANEYFKKLLSEEIADVVQLNAREWARKKIPAGKARYSKILNFLYDSAKRAIFCTCEPTYLGYWLSTPGKAVLTRHKARIEDDNIHITRAFIFENKEEFEAGSIDVDAYGHQLNRAYKYREILDMHAEAGVRVLVYFLEDCHDDKFFSSPRKDFAIIDHNDALGVTAEFAGGGFEAAWHFNPNETRIAEFMQYRDEITKHAKLLSTLGS